MGLRTPVADIAFTLRHIADLDELIATRESEDLSVETVETILNEAARFAENELDAIDQSGDRFGCAMTGGAVRTAPGWKDTYKRWTEGGWNGVSAPEKWGGQDLPVSINTAVAEFWNAGSAAFAAGPMLTAGAVMALEVHASDELKARYLPNLISGVWMATMNLTEPQAGSDLGALVARAERSEDGTYRIFGQKIFITYGEHDLTDNIIHLVLARLPDAPDGTGGISMFLVPKFLVNDNGQLGRRNDVTCVGVEHKLGMHASPTCTMAYGEGGAGAVGWLVGEENRGLAAMFTMMNIARLTVGMQGVGVAVRAYDRALTYARERRQGRAPGAAPGVSSPIIEHPDVQRMLLRMKAMTAASRAIALSCAHAIDMSRAAPAAERGDWANRASLLTPVAKAFATDACIEVASLGIQVHGGAGYIEQTGAAQHLRDARIFAIYEGTNGIQAIDLVARKLALANGTAVKQLIEELERIANKAAAVNRDDFGKMGARLQATMQRLVKATEFLAAAMAEGRIAVALAGATPYLRLFGLAAGGTLLAKGALHAAESSDNLAWIALSRFFAENIADETAGLATAVTDGAEALEKAATAYLVDPNSQF